jgi:hypothetical protein
VSGRPSRLAKRRNNETRHLIIAHDGGLRGSLHVRRRKCLATPRDAHGLGPTISKRLAGKIVADGPYGYVCAFPIEGKSLQVC